MPVNPKFTVGLVQMAVSGDVESNLDRAVVKVREAADAGAQVVCLPELFRSQYFCQKEAPENFDLAEPVPGPSTEALGRVARERKITIIAPIFERCTPGLYFNSAAILDQEGEISGLYRKMHIPDDPAYYEKYYFTPRFGFHAFDTPQCKDRDADLLISGIRKGAAGGTQERAFCFILPRSWHPHEKEQYGAAQRMPRITIQRSHAIANGVYGCGQSCRA